MMRIGLTGGTGFIGQYLLRNNAEQHRFVVLTSQSNKLGLYVHQNVEYIQCKYEEHVPAEMKKCDIIVHLGAQRPVGKLQNQMLDYMENILYTEKIFKFAVESGITNVINMSSCSVYDSSLELPYVEDSETLPQNCYGIAKLCCEKLAHMYNRNYNMKIKSLRVGRVFGVGERPEFMPAVFLDRCRKQERLTLKGNVLSTKDYIYVKDVVTAIMCACRCKETTGVFNISSGKETSNLELAQIYCKVFQNRQGYEVCEDSSIGKTRFVMHINKAMNQLGFLCGFTMEQAVADMRQELKEADED